MLQAKRGSTEAVPKPSERNGEVVHQDETNRKGSITAVPQSVFERRRSSFSDAPHPENMGRRGSVDIFDGKPNLGRRASISPLAPKLEAPTIAMIEHPTEGDRIMLECKISSNTQPEVIWYHLDDKIKEGGRYHITLKNIVADQWVSNLQINDINRKDAGKYTVRGKNEMGTNAASVFSFVEE